MSHWPHANGARAFGAVRYVELDAPLHELLVKRQRWVQVAHVEKNVGAAAGADETETAVEHDSPESYYSVSDRLAEEIPGGFKPDQYSNMANPEAHYRTTAPEIWEQTDGGQVDAIVISVGTGGTISGVGRFFKEHRPEVQIIGADPEGLGRDRDTDAELGAVVEHRGLDGQQVDAARAHFRKRQPRIADRAAMRLLEAGKVRGKVVIIPED